MLISIETAAKVWKCHDEIRKAEKLLEEMQEAIKNRRDPNPRDAFGNQRNLTLGVPSGENSHRLYDVKPDLAMSIIRAHIAEKGAELVAACEEARMELNRAIVAPHAQEEF